jgi:hypothetical protein
MKNDDGSSEKSSLLDSAESNTTTGTATEHGSWEIDFDELMSLQRRDLPAEKKNTIMQIRSDISASLVDEDEILKIKIWR